MVSRAGKEDAHAAGNELIRLWDKSRTRRFRHTATLVKVFNRLKGSSTFSSCRGSVLAMHCRSSCKDKPRFERFKSPSRSNAMVCFGSKACSLEGGGGGAEWRAMEWSREGGEAEEAELLEEAVAGEWTPGGEGNREDALAL